MTTKAPAALVDLQHRLEDAIASAVNAGIVGDQTHQTETSKHNSIEDNPAGSWAVIGPHDAAPPGRWSREYAAAFDTAMSRTDQNRVHNNLIKIFNDRSDPRRQFIAAFNGWNGTGSPARYNLVTNTVSVTDDSHKFHEHGETFYEYANDPRMTKAWLSGMLGEAKEQYLGGFSVTAEQQIADLHRALLTPRSWSAGGEKTTVDFVNDMAWAWLYGKPGVETTWSWKSAAGMVAQIGALNTVVTTLAEALRTGGGDLDTAAIMAKIDELGQKIAELDAELRQSRAEEQAARAEADQLRQELADALSGA